MKEQPLAHSHSLMNNDDRVTPAQSVIMTYLFNVNNSWMSLTFTGSEGCHSCLTLTDHTLLTEPHKITDTVLNRFNILKSIFVVFHEHQLLQGHYNKHTQKHTHIIVRHSINIQNAVTKRNIPIIQV